MLFDDEVDQLCLSSTLIVFIRISITPVNAVIIVIGLLHIIIFGVVVVMMMLIISSSVAQRLFICVVVIISITKYCCYCRHCLCLKYECVDEFT